MWGVLPEERARVRVVDVKKTYAVGELVELLRASPHRATPFCPVFGTCGGCQVQHFDYRAQLEWKRRLVADALQRIGGCEAPPVAGTIGMDEPRAYRNKMALVVRNDEDRLDFGFYQMRSHEFVPIAGCPVVLPQLDDQIAALRHCANDPSLKSSFEGVLHAVARAGKETGESILTLTTTDSSPKLARAAGALARRVGRLSGLGNSYAPASANAILGRKHRTLWGRDEMEERILIAGGKVLRYRVSAASFFQINTSIVAGIFSSLERLPRPRRIVDIYCGAGTFSILFASWGATVLGIEENAAAIREARANASLNAVADKTSFHIGRAESVLQRAPARKALDNAEVVFLDPPRKGCEPPVLDAVAAGKVPTIWYLSCNPATLARDVARLRQAGYTLEGVQPFDMFPQTGHVEALATLRRTDSGHG